MEQVTAWFERQAKRERGIVHLEDGLLAGRFGPYFGYRLRFFVVRWGAASVLQLTKVLLLRELFAPGAFLSVVSAAAVAGLMSGAWWGTLECLRTEVRQSYRLSSRTWTSLLIGRWVSAAVRAALLILGAVCLAVLAIAWSGVGPDAAALAVGAIAIRVAFELPVRAYHAGVYALRRVYRPVQTILVLEALSLGALVVLAQPLGAYAVAASELIVALAFALVAIRYTARAGRTLGLRPGAHLRILPRWSRNRRLGPAAGHWLRSAAVAVRAGAAPAAAGALMALDSLVVLALAAAAADLRPAGTWAALLLAAIAPTIRAGFDWAKLMYFDFKRLDAAWFADQRRHLDRAATIAALVIAGCLFVYAVVVADVILRLPSASWIGLAVLLAGASLLGLAQMEAFTRGAFRRVAVGGIGLGVGLAAAAPAAARGVDPLLFVGIVSLASAAATRLAGRMWHGGRGGPADAMLPTQWLTALRSTPGAVNVGTLRVPRGAWGPRPSQGDDRADGWRARRLARRLARVAGPDGGVTSLPPDRLLWFVPARVPGRGRRPLLDAAQALRAAGGRVRQLRTGGPFADGRTAVAEVVAWGAIEQARAVSNEPSVSLIEPARLIERFGALLPDGVVLRSGSSADDAWLSGRRRRTVLFAATAYARDLEPDRRALPLEVTAWCPAGRLEMLFVAHASAPRNARRRWCAELRAANLEAAAGGPLTRQAILDASARDRAPVALAASAATNFRREQ